METLKYLYVIEKTIKLVRLNFYLLFEELMSRVENVSLYYHRLQYNILYFKHTTVIYLYTSLDNTIT